jgi:hypothetical protein
MKYLFYISIIVIGAILITKDYRNTKGFRYQKVLHVLTILFIFITNIKAFSNLFAVLRNYKTYSEWSRIYTQIEYLPDELGLLLSFISSILGSILYVTAFGLLVRGNFSRKLVGLVAPLQALFGLPMIHYLFLHYQNNLQQTITTWVVIIINLTYLGLFFLYRSEFMKSFFEAKKKSSHLAADSNFDTKK